MVQNYFYPVFYYRDVYRSTDTKIRDYDRECRRDVDTSRTEITIRPAEISESKIYNTLSYGTPKGYSSYTREKSTTREPEYSDPPPKKGSWRKDLERYEEDLELKKVQKENQKKISSYTDTSSSSSAFQNKITNSIPTYSVRDKIKDEPSSKPSAVNQWKISTTNRSEVSVSKPLSYSWSRREPTGENNTQTGETTLIQPKVEERKASYTWKKSQETDPVIKETSITVDLKKSDTLKKVESNIKESKPAPKWKTSETVKQVEPKVEASKPESKWKKSDSLKIEEPKVEPKPALQVNGASTLKEGETNNEDLTPKQKTLEMVKKEGPKVEELKPAPKSKKAETLMKEEPKVEEPKLAPKWKKSETVKKEEPKADEPKPDLKWKKLGTTKKEETKIEEPKLIPKWKKPETVKKEEPKVEEPKQELKSAPKWKKTETVKKEEPKVEEPKPTPKWKKPETTKKEEPKAEEPKLTPKWKKPEATKKAETNVEEPKPEPNPTPKWKKTEIAKKEEPKVQECKPTPKLKNHETSVKEEPKHEESAPIEVVNTPGDIKVEEKKTCAATKPEPDKEEPDKADGEKKEDEEEEDTTGMRSMRKETDNKFATMDAEFEAGRSKLAALRAKMKRLREASKAAAEADAAADAANRKG